MARKMRKFSEGGAQGRYDRRMADIEKDFKKNSAGKSGKALEVLEAKRAQRTADAEDDRAKRTGADRTKTRAAEKAAEANLTKTRKYGAAQSVTKDTAGPTGKVTDTLGALTPLKSGLATSTKKAEVKKAPPKSKPSAADTARSKFFQDSLKKTNFKTAARMAEAPIAPSKFDKAAFDNLKTGKNSYGAANIGKTGDTKTGTKTETTKGTGTSRLAKAADPKDTSAAASRARAGAALSYLNPFSYVKGVKRLDPSEVNKAKGGKVMKYAKGGSTPANKKPMPKEPITGGANTVPLTPERKEFLKELAKRNAGSKKYAAGGVTKEMPSSKAMGSLGMAKGGKAKAKPTAKAKGKPFAATKFGAALMKKSADTKGRAMPKFAKGGSIDGCAVRGKTKAKRVTMACGGMAKGRK